MCCEACFTVGLSESVRLVAHLYSLRNDANVAGQARFGIVSRAEQLGLTLPVLRALARAHRRDHALALELWASGIHDARLLATLVENPKQITRAQMEQWVRAADNWALTDALAFLFDRTEFAEEKALAWSERKGEFVKRAGFATMAGMAIHRKELPDEIFLRFFAGARARGDGRAEFCEEGGQLGAAADRQAQRGVAARGDRRGEAHRDLGFARGPLDRGGCAAGIAEKSPGINSGAGAKRTWVCSDQNRPSRPAVIVVPLMRKVSSWSGTPRK